MKLRIKLEKYHYIALVGMLSKIITAILLLINTRILINLVGIKGFAVYSIIFSLLAWMTLFNFGFPQAIQNTISKLNTKNTSTYQLKETALWLIVVIILVAIPITLLISLCIKKCFLSEYNFVDLSTVYLSLFLLVFFGLTEFFSKILFAEHKGYYANMYATLSALMSFLILYLFYETEIRNFKIILFGYFFPNLILFILGYYQSMKGVKPTFHRLIYHELVGTSKKFFLFMVLSAGTLNIDYMVMSKILSSIEITTYNLDMRVFSIFLVLYYAILFALWPTISELFHQKQFALVKEKIHQVLIFVIFFIFTGSSIVVFFNKEIFLLISGKDEIYISLFTLIITAVYFFLRMFTDTFAVALQSNNEMDILLKVVPFQVIISFISQWFLGQEYGLNGIILGLIISYTLTVSWVLPFKFYKIIAGHNR